MSKSQVGGSMMLSLPPRQLTKYLTRQLRNLFPDGWSAGRARANKVVESALARMEVCASAVIAKRYRTDTGEPCFSHLHSGQYAAFLYFASHSAARNFGDHELATRLYLLNKALHGLDVYYEVELPDVFVWEHPVGTVLGKAVYGERFVVLQHCTVGGNLQLEYPRIGKHVSLYAGATIIGKCTIGDHVQVAAGARIVDEDVPSGSTVFGTSPNLTIRSRPVPYHERVFVT